jgi:hypothetical protein
VLLQKNFPLSKFQDKNLRTPPKIKRTRGGRKKRTKRRTLTGEFFIKQKNPLEYRHRTLLHSISSQFARFLFFSSGSVGEKRALRSIFSLIPPKKSPNSNKKTGLRLVCSSSHERRNNNQQTNSINASVASQHKPTDTGAYSKTCQSSNSTGAKAKLRAGKTNIPLLVKKEQTC